MKKIIVIFLGIITLSSGMILGACSVVNSQSEKKNENMQMIKLVESKEAEKAFYHWFTYVDPRAFKKEGFIQSYEIDRSSVSKNPMSGIDFNIIINGNSDFIISCNINKNSDGEIESTSATYSDKLSQALER
jgi:hypothetical protein